MAGVDPSTVSRVLRGDPRPAVRPATRDRIFEAAKTLHYPPNAHTTPHGDAHDCAGCHHHSGTGTWGTNQNWAAGHFLHAPTTVASTTCVACHATQRPDLLGYDAGTITFDHALNGTVQRSGPTRSCRFREPNRERRPVGALTLEEAL